MISYVFRLLVLLVLIGLSNVGLGNDLYLTDGFWLISCVDKGETALAQLLFQCVFVFVYFYDMTFKLHYYLLFKLDNHATITFLAPENIIACSFCCFLVI